jgi:hypothetical protein
VGHLDLSSVCRGTLAVLLDSSQAGGDRWVAGWEIGSAPLPFMCDAFGHACSATLLWKHVACLLQSRRASRGRGEFQELRQSTSSYERVTSLPILDSGEASLSEMVI